MALVEDVPQSLSARVETIDQLLNSIAEVLFEVIYHVLEGGYLVDKPRALREEYAIQKPSEPGRSLAPRALEVGGIKGRRVGDQSKVLRVTMKATQNHL